MIKQNHQLPEKISLSPAGAVEVHSIFSTIQGEGPFCGHPAIFIRLAGCNLQCPGCDTEYSNRRVEMYPEHILEAVMAHRSPNLGRPSLIVITGGEPFRQNIGPMINALLSTGGYFVQVESNGTLPPPAGVVWRDSAAAPGRGGAYLVISPKTGAMNAKAEAAACAYKYVACHNDMGDDGLPNHALGHPAKPRLARPLWAKTIYLQPMDMGAERTISNQANLTACVESCMANGHVLQLQIHKIIEME